MVFLERRRNGKTVQRALKTAPRFFFGRKRHLYKSAVLDWFSGWDSPVANADRSRPPCCRFHIPVETGGTKVTSRVSKILPSRTPRLAAEPKASRHDRPYRESCSSRKTLGLARYFAGIGVLPGANNCQSFPFSRIRL